MEIDLQDPTRCIFDRGSFTDSSSSLAIFSDEIRNTSRRLLFDQHIAFRRGKKRAAVALGHTLLIIIYHVIAEKRSMKNDDLPALETYEQQILERIEVGKQAGNAHWIEVRAQFSSDRKNRAE